MKRFFTIFLIVLMGIFLLTACSTNSSNNSDQSAEEKGEAVDSVAPIENSDESNTEIKEEKKQMKLQIGNNVLTASLADNSSAEALAKMLEAGPLTISMRDFGGMEKVGSLGSTLPENNEQITTEAGDLILYQAGAFVIYYAPNSWNFTRLGKINDITADELKAILGDGNVDVTLSLD
ncbi:cyclophilin-like fold protein [Eubacteriaceae bacterium ES3]|nr:cyclophilin-like fold protein [Eubacteriaceae bacterium ES3]